MSQSSQPPRKRRRKRSAAPARSRARLWLGVAGLLTLFLAISGAGMLYAAHQEEDDAFCASCHSEPESTYYQRAQATPAVDLASFHRERSTRCIDCHSGGGVTGRVEGLTVGAGDLAAYLAHTARQPAVVTVPISDDHCLKCHSDTLRTQDFQRHFHAFLPRWQAIDPQAAKCVDCHTAHTTDGDAQILFLQQQHTVAICERCHNTLGER
jgi:predicted CXXCH cytochrome family protein